MNLGIMPGRYPAIVSTYDAATRMCRVQIPGLTDGGDVLPNAEIEYSIGDKSRNGPNTTEIEIVPGDHVWVSFIAGDPRYPIITGYRNPGAGNSDGWRRWHHANIEMLADLLITALAGREARIKAGGGDVQLQASESVQVRAAAALRVHGEGGRTPAQMTSGGDIVIHAKGGRITLKSISGTLVI